MKLMELKVIWMKRLTHRNEDGKALVWVYADPEKPAEVCRQQLKKQEEVIEKLAHYEDLEEAGRLVGLPCAVGSEVYAIEPPCDRVIPCNILKEFYVKRCLDSECGYYVGMTHFDIAMLKDFGKTVFLTRREAEAALKGGDLDE